MNQEDIDRLKFLKLQAQFVKSLPKNEREVRFKNLTKEQEEEVEIKRKECLKIWGRNEK